MHKTEGVLYRWESSELTRGFVRRRVAWLTNSQCLAGALKALAAGTCPDQKRFVIQNSGLVSAFGAYAANVTEAILQAAKHELELSEKLSAMQSHSSGPFAEEPFVPYAE